MVHIYRNEFTGACRVRTGCGRQEDFNFFKGIGANALNMVAI